MTALLLQIVTDNPVLAAYASFFVLSGFAVVVSGYVNKFLKASGITARIISWAVVLVLVIGGWYFDLGYLADQTIGSALLDVLNLALVSNGIFTTNTMKTILGVLKATQPSVAEYLISKPE